MTASSKSDVLNLTWAHVSVAVLVGNLFLPFCLFFVHLLQENSDVFTISMEISRSFLCKVLSNSSAVFVCVHVGLDRFP